MKVFEPVEFCMQFDNDEPHVIGATEQEDGCIEVRVTPTMDGGITFGCPTTGKKVRLYARPITELGREILNPPQE